MSDRRTDKQYLLDLLVDGELSDDDRREVLAWCQREPDGWRRCALAFLEAQSWSKVLGDLNDETALATGAVARTASNNSASDEPRSIKPLVSPVARRWPFWHVRQGGTMLAMAASVVLAFMLGLWARDAAKSGRLAPAEGPAVRAVGEGIGSEGNSTTPAGRRPGLPEQGLAGSPRLGVGGRAGAADEIHLPVVVDDELDGDWLRAQPAAMPDDVRQALERLGHRVDQQRRLVPYHLGDGRRVVVPVDEVQIRPVENRAYQ